MFCPLSDECYCGPLAGDMSQNNTIPHSSGGCEIAGFSLFSLPERICGVVAMMNAQECRKKAEECLRSAESNPSGRDQWQHLSNMWSIVAGQRADLERDRTVPGDSPRTVLGESRRDATLGVADILRERLELT